MVCDSETVKTDSQILKPNETSKVHHVANFKHSKSIIDFSQTARPTIMPAFKRLIDSDNYQDETPCQSKEK
ncbi:hypothetical protein HGM15179_000479 [Zosterops borbonicus]|uniref:Uncharacterized protein n=1 Tax=Zosterops borbonicus TaxID=364589 RepID=A0A8K1GYY6_9PASS|nr:hypothetical protein HGM15179_000479 [Zosterops borbonicus]